MLLYTICAHSLQSVKISFAIFLGLKLMLLLFQQEYEQELVCTLNTKCVYIHTYMYVSKHIYLFDTVGAITLLSIQKQQLYADICIRIRSPHLHVD